MAGGVILTGIGGGGGGIPPARLRSVSRSEEPARLHSVDISESTAGRPAALKGVRHA